MKTISINTYQFNELSEDAKKVALSWAMECDLFDSSFLLGEAEELGLNIESFDLNRNRHAKGSFILSAQEVAQNILNNHGESCETYKTAYNFMEEWQPVFNNYMDEAHEDYESKESEETMAEIETDFLDSILEDYSILLQEEYEDSYSDEYLIDFIEANEYDFLESGKRF